MMTTTIRSRLVWAQARGMYVLYEGDVETLRLSEDGAALAEWSATRRSFAFEGHAGHASLLREARPHGGAGYWYAYCRQGKRTRKQYIGRSEDLTPQRLETAVATLAGGNADQHDATNAPLLMPKLQPPRLGGTLIRRERLLQKMDEGFQHGVMILAAPAGFGKTTLARQWIAERCEQPDFPLVGWVTLNADENDPVRFWRYVMAACETFAPGCSTDAQDLLQARNRFKPIALETVLTVFLNALTQAMCQGLLVLEDLHVITAPETQTAITFFLEHLPSTVRVLILARGTLPFFAARLMVDGEFWGIFPPDLCFTREETQAFLARFVPVALPDDLMAQVQAQTRGWPVGLRMLAIALKPQMAQAQVWQYLQEFAGNQRPITEYFVAEVLNSQPPEVQAFLLHTSALPRLTGALCDAVTGRADGQQVLERLLEADIFLEPLYATGAWYRYHTLFAEAMQQEATRRLGADALRMVNQRASEWFAGQGMLADAIDATLRAGLMAEAVALLQRLFGQQPFQIGAAHTVEFHTLCRWMEQIPEGVLRNFPDLCVIYASVLLMLMQTQRRPAGTLRLIEGLLQAAEQHWERDGNVAKRAAALALQAMLATERGSPAESLAFARRALADLPPDEIVWRSCCLTVLATDENTYGNLGDARDLFTEAQRLSASSGNMGFTRANTGMLSATLAEQGELHLAAANFQQMLAEARAQGDRDDICRSQLCLAGIAYEWNTLDVAWESANESLQLAEAFENDELRVHASLTLARIEQARGRVEAARERLQRLYLLIQPLISPIHQQLHRTIVAWQIRVALSAGDLAPVQRWAAHDGEEMSLPLPLLFLEQGNLARWRLAQGDGVAVQAIIAPLLAQAQQAGRGRAALEMRILLALAQQAQGDLRAARESMHGALVTAQAEGYRRVFLDEGAAMQRLLQTTLPHTRGKALTAYVQDVLRASVMEHGTVGGEDGGWSDAVLTAQERRVLSFLAAGRSNADMATELVISVNTVKAHVKSIYRKLQVSTRVEALTTARGMGLV